MPTSVIGELEISTSFRDGKVKVNRALTVDVEMFRYEMAGLKARFDGAANVSVTDNATNFVCLDSAGLLDINQVAFPAGAHIRLATVVASNGAIQTILDERDFLKDASHGIADDSNAFHDDESAEISALTEKVTPLAADHVLIEDSADSNSKKRVQAGNLPFPLLDGTQPFTGAVGGIDPVVDADLSTKGYVDTQIGAAWLEDEFVATGGQVTFILGVSPRDLDSVQMHVNGIAYDDDDDFTVSGTTLTWLNALFSMDAGDKILVRYV